MFISFNPIRTVISGFVELNKNLGIFRSNSIIPVFGWLGVIGVVTFLFFSSNFQTWYGGFTFIWLWFVERNTE